MTTSQHLSASPTNPLPRQHRPADYVLRLATSQADVIAAQSLRYGVFALELGAVTPGPPGLDADEYDDLCDHLIVWHRRPGHPAEAVGTYRLLPPHSNDHQPRANGLCANGEFGLMPMESILDRTVALGRACVRADHRGGPAIAMLWRGIASYLESAGHRYLLGCASMPITDGGRSAAAFWDRAVAEHLAPAHRRCRPRNPVPIGRLPRAARAEIPPLLAGYLRLGAKVCGPPAHDEMFGTADFLLLLDLALVKPGHLGRFSPVER
ncbi:GNAT family N-acetyltransferase [Nakamurella sp.]|uniref:GNAT family N-acetyltransferase n=1 Tax=Nakamurella sp. TaxID=1869182 RepID=UPI0037845CF7